MVFMEQMVKIDEMDMMDKMDPQQLKKMMAVAQKVQAATAPLQKVYSWMNRVTGGRAVSVIVAAVGVGMCYFIDYFFFSDLCTTSLRGLQICTQATF